LCPQRRDQITKGDHGRVTETEIIEYVSGLAGVVAIAASKEIGAPESAWGDSFFYYDPDGNVAENRRFPFATLVISDYPGWDTESDLDRDGIFRVNVAVGRGGFERLLGYTPKEHAAHHDDFDYTATDVLLPHPLYASQGWVSIVNPGYRTSIQLQKLVEDAHGLAIRRYARRRNIDD
jgi:Family of unknown function (DUF6194)